jgi:hypothetical protein
MSEIELGHVHNYSGKRVIDECHFVTVAKICKDCRAVHRETLIRDFSLGPLEVAFADPGCRRCVAMLEAAGLTPASWGHV